MILKKTAIILSLAMAIILVGNAFEYAPLKTISEPIQLTAISSQEIPFKKPFPINSLSLSGNWEGEGFGQAFLIASGQKYLVFDSNKKSRQTFEKSCTETCNLPLVTPDALIFVIYEGKISISEAHYEMPNQPLGLALCPNCKKATQISTPKHGFFLLVISLLVAIIGSHFISSSCTTKKTKIATALVFASGFAMMTLLFVVQLSAPTSELADVTNYLASIFAAGGVITLFTIGGLKFHKTQKETESLEEWKQMGETEDKWEKRE